MLFKFLRMHSDPTTNNAPLYWQVEASTRTGAIEKFCKEYHLTLVEIVGEPVWFETEDKAMMRYLVSDGE